MIIIGMVIGVVFLMLGESVSGLKQFNSQLHEIVGELLSLVSKVMPAVPFLSIMILMANGEFSTLIMGWKYIVASLICIFLCLVIKIVKVTTKCKVSFPVLWRKMKPAVHHHLADHRFAAILSFDRLGGGIEYHLSLPGSAYGIRRSLRGIQCVSQEHHCAERDPLPTVGRDRGRHSHGQHRHESPEARRSPTRLNFHH